MEELQEPVALIIWTLCPEKWKIEDMETGQVYIGDKNIHPKFGPVLEQIRSSGKIGQWKKL